MKKIHKYYNRILIVLLLSAFSGCSKDYLETEPVDIITEDIILSDKPAFMAHLAYLYNNMAFERINYWMDYNTDILVNCFSGQTTSALDDAQTFTSNTQEYNFWETAYVQIRNLNNIIAKFPESTAFQEPEKSQVLGELKFLRAYTYFRLVRGYGGVPLITEVMEMPASGDPSELARPRDSEEDVWEYIDNEMTEAIGMMSSKKDDFRINKWSGLAFKSRAMLHAASIAKYSEIQLDGILGIPASKADYYFESARDAAWDVIESGQYELYNKDEDKAANYRKMIFDESAANRERIFVTAYYWPLKTHPFDRNSAPYNHRSAEGYGSYFNVTLDMVESYEYVDNRDGSLKLYDEEDNQIVYNNAEDLFIGKDPRFFASVNYPGAPWKGIKLQVWGNIIEGGVEKDGYGPDGISPPEATSTGFCLSKWADPNPPRPINGSSSEVDRICIRYAEVLLNYAEAQFELENEPEARTYVNMIRNRAGIMELTDPITMEDIVHERKVELAFEDHRYWDTKRWRTLHIIMDNSDTYGLWPILNKDNNTFVFRPFVLNVNKFRRTYYPHMYYYKIAQNIIESNRLLIQNPGY
ncbi:MAG: RagB/SusD family nutrient uptake outer membrane protein [Bacteroidales bacterium]|jgi:hypothetical protein|nr:RagB/SusD family nutrient uptake outer membrane protein [Bacteroidales bacterium]